jgi:predicted nucleotidyltransferase
MAQELDAVKDILRKFIAVLDARFRIRRVILFGSYAHGRATEDSDIDVAVISADFSHQTLGREGLFKYRWGISTLLAPLACRPEDFDEATLADFCFEIKRTGVVIYDDRQGGMLI